MTDTVQLQLNVDPKALCCPYVPHVYEVLTLLEMLDGWEGTSLYKNK
jgi:hypothetical protein